MVASRVSRGRRSQELLAEHFRSHGWLNAKSRPASLPGTDIYDMPGLAPEVKATRGNDHVGALRQAKKNAKDDELYFVIHRPDGYGEQKIGQWLVIFDLDTATALLRAAGYGE